MRRVHDQLAELLTRGALEAYRLEPGGRDPAGGGLTLADLVAIQDQDARAEPASCRATVSPAKLAPHTITS